MSAIAAMACSNCEVSDAHDAFFVRDPKTGELVGVVTRCKVCGFRQLI